MRIGPRILCLLVVLIACWMPCDGRADVAAFYSGKTITIVSPDAAGSGYDAYARLVGRFIGDYIPGQPKVIVQNMPGAGGVIQANHLYNIAPKDGSVLAIMMHGVIFRPIFDPREVRYKVDGFRWLGSVTPIVVIGAFSKGAAQSVADLFEREVLVGLSTGTTSYLPRAINAVLQTRMKLISGYRSTNDILLAIERKEVSGVVGIGLDSIQTLAGNKLGDLKIVFQMGAARSPSLPDVPLIQESAKSDLDRRALEAIFASFSIGRVFATPEIPDDRYLALKAAFEKVVKDPRLIDQAMKQKSAVEYVSPEAIERVIGSVYGQPAAVLTRAAEVMGDEN
jgi:tripartite-type tricarboxylate transporter receptor subunit TctC